MFVIIVNGLLYAITIYKKTCGRKKVRSNQKIDKWGQIMGSVGLFVLLGKYLLNTSCLFVCRGEATWCNTGAYAWT